MKTRVAEDDSKYVWIFTEKRFRSRIKFFFIFFIKDFQNA